MVCSNPDKMLLGTTTLACTALLVDMTDLMGFMIVYEATLLLFLPVLGSSSSAYSKSYALASLGVTLMVGTMGALMSLTVDGSSETFALMKERKFMLSLGMTMLVLAKLPAYPLHFWLPEAHVEATWVGSALLASLILKFSTWLIILMLGVAELMATPNTLMMALSMITILTASVAMMATDDVKKLGAFLSLLHMGSSVLPMLHGGTLLLWGSDTLWLAHALTAFHWFYSVGWVYSTSGSSAASAWQSTDEVMSTVMLTLMVLQLGIPVAPYLLSELSWHTPLVSMSPIAGLPFIFMIMFQAMSLSTTIGRLIMDTDVSINMDQGVYSIDLIMLVSSGSLIWSLWPD